MRERRSVNGFGRTTGNLFLGVLSAAAFSVLGACASNPPPPTASGAGVAPPASFADQVAQGQTLYGANCANCHGDSGQGTAKAPRVVGVKDGALPLDPPADRKYRKNKFVTVADVAEFTVANMPPGKAGSLTNDQYWAILAFDLHANGIDLPSPLTPEVAKTLTIPR
ncbi:MAG TPA: c-type cytochrome [Polyangia bacterium]|nr:c-type cytochrome [Polyangia bacterium]